LQINLCIHTQFTFDRVLLFSLKKVIDLIFVCKIAIAAGFYQIKIPGITPDRIKLGMHYAVSGGVKMQQ
jgi:hypothetical protein